MPTTPTSGTPAPPWSPSGFGVALVPRLADLPAHHNTRRIPITTPPIPTRRVITAVRAGSENQPTVAAGLQALRDVIATGLPALDGT